MKKLLLLLIVASMPTTKTLFAGLVLSTESKEQSLEEIIANYKTPELITEWETTYGKDIVNEYLAQFSQAPRDGIDKVDMSLKTQLAIAAYDDEAEEALQLLSQGANPNGFTTATIDSLTSNDLGMSMYLDADTNVAKKTEYWAPPLYFASKYGHTEVVRLLVGAEGIILDACVDFNKSTAPLHVAANAEIAHILLNAGANKHARDAHNWSALHRAIFDERIDVAKMLVEEYEAGDFEVDIIFNGQNTTMTALDMAKNFGFTELATIIENSSSYRETL